MSGNIEQQPDGSKYFHSKEPFTLLSGEVLSHLILRYETWGILNSTKSNAVLIHHALSVGSHVTSSEKDSEKGWWQEMVGPGKAIDTSKYFVICINNLGSCFGSSGPLSPLDADGMADGMTGKYYRGKFPQVDIQDMVVSQKLLADHIGITKFHAIVGASMGAMLSLSWGIEYPDTVEKMILISSGYKAYPANIANRSIQRQAIYMDPDWQQGNYTSSADISGFRLARKLGLYSYRNSTEWNRRFNSHNNHQVKDTEIIEYMEYNAEKFCKKFDANSYLILTKAMDYFDVTKSYQSLDQCFSRVLANTLIISVESDVLFTPQQQEELQAALKANGVESQYINHHSQYGHDAFLVEIEPFTEYIGTFLDK